MCNTIHSEKGLSDGQSLCNRSKISDRQRSGVESVPEASQHQRRFHHADWLIRGNVVRTGTVPHLPRAEFGFTLWNSPVCCHCMIVRFLISSTAHKLTINLSYSSGRFDSRDMKQIFVCVTPVALLQLAFAIPLTLSVLDNTMLACAVDDDT